MRAYPGLVCAFVSVASLSAAQTTPAAKTTIAVGDFELSPEMEVRTRAEYRQNPVDMGGFGTPYIQGPWAVMERTRIGLGADRGPLRAKVTFQDARVWGSNAPIPPLTSPFASTGVYEAFIEIHTTDAATTKPGAGADGSRSVTPQYIRVGRQAIVWDGGRLLGNADFSPVARTLDAVRAHAGWKSLDFEAFAAILDEAAPVGIGFGDPTNPPPSGYAGGSQLYGALASLTLDPLFRAQVYELVRPATTSIASEGLPPGLAQSPFALSRALGDNWTTALGISGDSKGWKYGVTGALQLGRIGACNVCVQRTAALDRLAYAVVGDISRTFDGVVLTPTVKIGAAYASGGQSGTQYNQFDPLYPDVQVNHGLLGAFAWSNILEVHGAVSVVPVADFRVTAEYRYARVADNTTGEWLDTYLGTAGTTQNNNIASQELGHEVDLLVSYRPWPALNIAAGYSLLILGDGAKSMLLADGRTSPNSTGVLVPPDLSHYAFVQLTLNVPARP